MSRTDAPSIFHLHAGLCSLAVAIGVRCWVDGAAREIYPNLNSVSLAPSGMGKSVPLDMASNIVHKAGLGDTVLPASFSQEALLERLSQQNVGFFVVQEFAAFQSLLSRDYNSGAEQTLTELFDVPEVFQRKLRKSEGFTLRHPCITILGASSPEWFGQAFKTNSLRGGWLARFLFCPSRDAGDPVGDPGPRDQGLEAGLADHLRRVGDLSGRFDTSATRQQYNDFSQKCRLAARESPDFGGMRSRGPVMALKLAMLFRVSRDPTSRVLAERDMDAAIRFVESTHQAAEFYLQNEVAYNDKDAQRLRLIDVIRSKGTRCQWSVALKNSHMDKLEFERAVLTLRESGTIDLETEGRSKWLRVCQFSPIPISPIRSEFSRNGELSENGAARATRETVRNGANSRETDLPF